jgi:hypothetical protein
MIMSLMPPIFLTACISQEVVNRSYPWPSSSASSRLLLVNSLLGLFDQLTKSPKPRSAMHAFRMELLELSSFSADADELDRLAGDVLDAQGRAAAGVASSL